MRQRLLFILVLLLMIPTLKGQDLDDFRWKKRLILLMDTRGDLSVSKEQLRLFDAYGQEMKDRDLIIFVYDGKIMRDKAMKKVSLKVQNMPLKDFQGVVLIGKDGGVKFKERFMVAPATIFDIVDSMPMRQAEIKNRNTP